MLILTRHIGEKILMGEIGEIKIKILGVRGAIVKIGISAPSNMPVHRQEIFDKIQEKLRKEEEEKEEKDDA